MKIGIVNSYDIVFTAGQNSHEDLCIRPPRTIFVNKLKRMTRYQAKTLEKGNELLLY
jgi:hypothetical protein